MTIKFKGLSMFLVLCLCLIVLAACSDETGGDNAEGSGGNTGSSGDEVITLTVVEWTNNNTGQIHDAIQSAVHAEYPNINLEFENINWSSDFRSTMQTRIATGTMHDIVMLKGDNIADYAPEGYFIDLTSKDFMSDFPPGLLNDISVDGKVYAVPYTTNYQGVFYNKDLFEEFGVDVPQTYEEFQAAVDTFNNNGITPFVAHFSDYQIGNMTMQLAMAEVFSKNPDWGLDLQSGDVSFATSEGYRNVFEHVKYYYENAQDNAFGTDFTMATELFARGDIAMYQIGTWAVGQILQSGADFEMGLFAFPGGWDEPTLLIQPDHTWAGNVESKHPDAVVKVLEILATNKELARQYIDYLAVDSLITGVFPSDSQPYHEDVAWYQENDRLMDVNIGNVQIPWSYQTEYSSYLADWLFGHITLDEALERADEYKVNVNFPRSP